MTRMLLMFGEGESGITSQGRLDHSQSFSQETGAIGQQAPRIGDDRPKLKELSAWMHTNSVSTPHLFFSALGVRHYSHSNSSRHSRQYGHL
jgi:hypothetical protein